MAADFLKVCLAGKEEEDEDEQGGDCSVSGTARSCGMSDDDTEASSTSRGELTQNMRFIANELGYEVKRLPRRLPLGVAIVGIVLAVMYMLAAMEQAAVAARLSHFVAYFENLSRRGANLTRGLAETVDIEVFLVKHKAVETRQSLHDFKAVGRQILMEEQEQSLNASLNALLQQRPVLEGRLSECVSRINGSMALFRKSARIAVADLDKHLKGLTLDGVKQIMQILDIEEDEAVSRMVADQVSLVGMITLRNHFEAINSSGAVSEAVFDELQARLLEANRSIFETFAAAEAALEKNAEHLSTFRQLFRSAYEKANAVLSPVDDILKMVPDLVEPVLAVIGPLNNMAEFLEWLPNRVEETSTQLQWQYIYIEVVVHSTQCAVTLLALALMYYMNSLWLHQMRDNSDPRFVTGICAFHRRSAELDVSFFDSVIRPFKRSYLRARHMMLYAKCVGLCYVSTYMLLLISAVLSACMVVSALSWTWSLQQVNSSLCANVAEKQAASIASCLHLRTFLADTSRLNFFDDVSCRYTVWDICESVTFPWQQGMQLVVSFSIVALFLSFAHLQNLHEALCRSLMEAFDAAELRWARGLGFQALIDSVRQTPRQSPRVHSARVLSVQ